MKILVGYDGSEVAMDALKLAKKHVQAFGGELFIVSSMKGGPQVQLDEIEKTESKLEYAKEAIQEDGITCETQLLFRGLESGEDLVQFAREKEIDEIVIGVRRRSKVGKFLFGSTAQFVILEAPCPVVTVK